jgi:hypothetical protein
MAHRGRGADIYICRFKRYDRTKNVGCKHPTYKALQMNQQSRKYQVNRIETPLDKVDADWNKPFWQEVEALPIDQVVGDPPAHRPPTRAKLQYDDEAVYVIFQVEDRYVRAVAKEIHDNVCQDSCVEFFFTPGKDIAAGYFNLEVNAGGVPLLHFQTAPRQAQLLTEDEVRQIEIKSTQPRIIEPEITEPLTWTLEYRLPLAILEKYLPIAKPAPGVTWRANLYKCADATSGPHWLTWSPLDLPKPDFHVPQFFGTLQFQ